jgi:hypothetical protein
MTTTSLSHEKKRGDDFRRPPPSRIILPVGNLAAINGEVQMANSRFLTRHGGQARLEKRRVRNDNHFFFVALLEVLLLDSLFCIVCGASLTRL